MPSVGLPLPALTATAARSSGTATAHWPPLAGLLRRIRGLQARHRDTLFAIGDFGVAAAATAALGLLTEEWRTLDPHRLALLSVTAGALVTVANILWRNYRLAWVTFSLSDLKRLAGASGAVLLTLALLSRLGILAGAPNPVVWGMTLFVALSAFRGSRRLLAEPESAGASGRRTLIVMSSRHAYFLPNVLRRTANFDYHIVGIVDPDCTRTGSIEQGLEVLGTTDDIEGVVERYRIEVVMVLLEQRPGFRIGDLYTRLNRLESVEVKTLPSLTDLIDDRSDIGALERMSIHELTGRPPVAIDVSGMRRVFGGKRVLVTGAGGSIGSELCRQLAKFSPARIVLFERDDSNLFYIDRELRSLHPQLDASPFLGDITSARDLANAFGKHRPEVVFHAAAYKHVPILEFHPADAIGVNVVGAHGVAQAALRVGTRCFIYISTDKAVNPTSTMGASKRLGEMLVTSMNGLADMRVMAVRFGNVLDSRGSVTTIFRDAISRRQPITVTHPDMRRYFMLTSEAVLLVLHAAAMGKGGEVFALDMGEPVRICALARRMVEMAGLKPDIDVPVVFTGPRPGEKLFEELLTAEEGTVATTHDRILRARVSGQYCYPDLLEAVGTLSRGSAHVSPDEVKKQLAGLVRSYSPAGCAGLKPSCDLAVACS